MYLPKGATYEQFYDNLELAIQIGCIEILKYARNCQKYSCKYNTNDCFLLSPRITYKKLLLVNHVLLKVYIPFEEIVEKFEEAANSISSVFTTLNE